MSSINGPLNSNSQPRWTGVSGDQTTVEAGETLSDVAKRLGLDVKALAAANPQIADASGLKPGQQVRLPSLPQQHSSLQDVGAGQSGQPSSPPMPWTLPSAPIGDPLASVVAHGALLKPSPTAASQPSDSSSTQSAAGANVSPLTAADLQNLPLQSSTDPVDPAAAQTLEAVGWSVTISASDQQRASQIVGTVDGASSFLQSLLAPYFSLHTGGEVQEDTSASSKLRADTIQAMQNEMLLTSVRLAQTVYPGLSPLNVSGEDNVRSVSDRWKDDTAQNLNDVLKHAMAAARMMKSREQAKTQLEEISAKLSALISQATVALANALAEAHHEPKNRKNAA